MKKEPKQQRSRQIVSSILEGATRVLSSLPLDETTTKKIAEVAGVGIGSLYDYFPDKKAIVVNLIDNHIQETLVEFSEILKDPTHKKFPDKVDAVVEYLFKRLIDRRVFLREIFLIAPETGRLEQIYQSRVLLSKYVVEYFKTVKPDLPEAEMNERAFLCVASVLGIIESYLILEPVMVSKPALEKSIKTIIFDTLDV